MVWGYIRAIGAHMPAHRRVAAHRKGRDARQTHYKNYAFHGLSPIGNSNSKSALKESLFFRPDDTTTNISFNHLHPFVLRVQRHQPELPAIPH